MMADEKGEGKELELDGKGKSKKMIIIIAIDLIDFSIDTFINKYDRRMKIFLTNEAIQIFNPNKLTS